MAAPRICTIPGCGKATYVREYCNAHYKRMRRHGDPLGGAHYFRAEEIEAFYQNVVLPFADKDACLEWPFRREARGYGNFKDKGVTVWAHNRACRLVHGEPPTPKHMAAHGCNNKPCVNPHHLRWATDAENKADMKLHGTVRNGVKNHMAKLNDDLVREIRAMAEAAEMPQWQIGRIYGVSQGIVSAVKRREKWGHVA